MIPFIEDYLSEIIQSKISYIKSNPNSLGKILQISQTKLDKLNNYIQNKGINVILGYPRTPAELPCVCILLSGESEEPVGLGDYDEYEDDYSSSSFIEQIVVTQKMVDEKTISLSKYPLLSLSSITNLSLTQQLPTGSYSVFDANSGKVSITPDSLHVGDTLRFSYTYMSETFNRSEVLYSSNYRIEAWTDNGELTVQMYHLLKWILLSSRPLLLDKGLSIQKLSGNDFEPVQDLFPTFVYRRAVFMYTQYLISVFDGQSESYIKNINTDITLQDWLD